MILYLDDGILAANGLNMTAQASKQVQMDLAKAGFIVNWEPVKKLTWLGFEGSGQLTVPDGKLTSLCELLQSLLEKTFVPAKVFAGVVLFKKLKHKSRGLVHIA